MSLNNILINREKGQLSLEQNFNVVNCQVKNGVTSEITAGEAVKLVDVAGEIPRVETAAASDDIFGFVVYNQRTDGYVGDEMVKVAVRDCVMVMEAGEAISAGTEVEYQDSDKKVITSSGTNTKVGRALEKASADEDLIRVWIDTPIASVDTSILSTITYDSGAGALPLTAGVIFLETGGAEALTLADGTLGQELVIIMTVDGGDGTLTPDNLLGGSTITFDNVGESVHLIFNGTNWCVVGTATATVA